MKNLNKIVTDNGGKITGEDNWGKRKLAYSIKNLDHAVYVFYKAEIPAQGVRKIEATLNITDEVIRFLITKPDEKAIAKAGRFLKLSAKVEKISDVESDSRKEKSE